MEPEDKRISCREIERLSNPCIYNIYPSTVSRQPTRGSEFEKVMTLKYNLHSCYSCGNFVRITLSSMCSKQAACKENLTLKQKFEIQLPMTLPAQTIWMLISAVLEALWQYTEGPTVPSLQPPKNRSKLLQASIWFHKWQWGVQCPLSIWAWRLNYLQTHNYH